MIKHRIIKTIIIISCVIIFAFCYSCSSKNYLSQTQTNITQDTIEARIKFDKKYYYLGYNNYTKNEYYTFCSDGTASYNHIMQDGNKTIFHQIINFKWTYTGDGICVLLHNGTDMIMGEQDDIFGFCRVMHLSNNVVYWTASEENTYFICEDFVGQIPNYSKFTTKK